MVQVFLQTNRFRKELTQYMPGLVVPLPYPTNDSLEFYRWASYLCERIFKPDYQYKKAGIMLSEITPVTRKQGDLLEPETTCSANLMQVLDTLNQRYGRGTVKVSTQGAFKGWQMRQERISPNDTVCWQEIPVV